MFATTSALPTDGARAARRNAGACRMWSSEYQSRRRVSGAIFATVLAAGCAEVAEQPRLIVSVSVDQLRADMLDRYDPLFTHGLRRLRDEGYNADSEFDSSRLATSQWTPAVDIVEEAD